MTTIIHVRIPDEKMKKLKESAAQKSIPVATEAKIRLCQDLN